MEYFTIQNVTAFFVFAGYSIAFLRWLAPKTSSTLDDSLLHGIDKAKSWASHMSPYFWAIIEQMEKTGQVKKLNKASEFLAIARQAYREANGDELPAPAEAVAKQVAAGLSAQEKLAVMAVAGPNGLSGNPQTAQVSQ